MTRDQLRTQDRSINEQQARKPPVIMMLRLALAVCIIASVSAATEIIEGYVYDLTNQADPSPDPHFLAMYTRQTF